MGFVWFSEKGKVAEIVPVYKSYHHWFLKIDRVDRSVNYYELSLFSSSTCEDGK
jgi:hypothetical protein